MEYLFRRLRERLGDQALTSIMEQLYDFIIVEKEPSLRIMKRLNNKRGRKSKVGKYLTAKSLQEALKLLEEDFKHGKISRRTYFYAKKALRQRF